MQTIIIGNSAAGLNALEVFRKIDKNSPVTIISKEAGPAYSRVLLPYYLRKKITYDKLFIKGQGYYDELNALYLQSNVTKVDEKQRLVELENGKILQFDRLLIATGSTPVKPPIEGLESPGVFQMWTLDDVHKIERYFQPGKRVLILGSGFVSLQAAWAAVQRGLKVTVFELMPRIMPRVLDDQGANFLHGKILEYGVDLKVGMMTERVARNSKNSLVIFAKEQVPLEVDLIIAGTGVRPNINFLQDSTIKLDKGIVVNRQMETSVPGIFAAGDVAQGPTTFGGKREIHALWPTAVEQGKVAGANMAGYDNYYQGSLNMNVTGLFGITVASMGKFADTDGNIAWKYCDEKQASYLKITFKDEIPRGGIAVGNADCVSVLGYLRTLIRQKRRLDGLPVNLWKELHLKIADAGLAKQTTSQRSLN